MKPGYYWVRFPSDHFAVVGYYSGEDKNNPWPWEFVGSDEPISIGPDTAVLGPVSPPPNNVPSGR